MIKESNLQIICKNTTIYILTKMKKPTEKIDKQPDYDKTQCLAPQQSKESVAQERL